MFQSLRCYRIQIQKDWFDQVNRNSFTWDIQVYLKSPRKIAFVAT